MSRPRRGGGALAGGYAPRSLPASVGALQAFDLHKTYRGSKDAAVDGVTFDVAPGEIVGLLGPNGAGKSTTIGMVTTRIPATTGEVLIEGISATREPARARAGIGVTGQSNTLDGSCTIFENLYLHCRYHGMRRSLARRRATDLLHTFHLADRGTAKPDVLSGGLMRRLQLARAMAHMPSLLLLDEPTNELDVPSQTFFWEQISRLRASGRTAVLLATHLLEEAEEHCDRVLILDAGQIVLEGQPSELRRKFRGVRTIELELREEIGRDALDEIRRVDGVIRCTADRGAVTILLGSSDLHLEQIVPLVSSFGVEELTARKASLREIFLDVVDTKAWGH